MKPKILVVDDYPAMRLMLLRLLENDFDVVASVGTGLAAIEAATKLAPDVLVLDVAMPIMDGPEVAKRLKERGCNAKIVFISVSEDVSQVSACLAAGGDAYVSKIRMARDLVAVVRKVLGGETFPSLG